MTDKNSKEPFRLDIPYDDDDLNYVLEEPRPRGEVYFSNPQRFSAMPPPPPAPKIKKSHGGRAALVALALALAASLVLSYMGVTLLQDIFALRSDVNTREEEVTIQPNQSTNQVIDNLAKHRLITQRGLCKFYSDFTFKIKHQNNPAPLQPEYLPGKYTVSNQLGLEEMLNSFKSKPKTAETVHLMFPEGYTVRQSVERIEANRVASVDSMKRALMDAQFPLPFLQGVNMSGRYYRYEGYLFPDTYDFFVGDNVNSVIQRFLDNFQKKWKEYGFGKQADAIGMTMDQVIILASIIQKEAANAKEMPLVSRILHNRLDHPSTYSTLDCDSTRDYVLGNIAKEMDSSSAAYYADLYDTYKCRGLPVGPICNPGAAAIDAALNPSKEPASLDLFYFQHDKNGKIYTAQTRAEHTANTSKIMMNDLAQ
jgi:UPF0755 protein